MATLLISSFSLSNQNMHNTKIGSGEWEFDCSLTKKSLKSGYLSEMLGTIKDWK